MAIQLSPSSFLANPSLPTAQLEGAEEANSQLLFSDNDQWLLAWGDSGHLQVWDVRTCHRRLFFNQIAVRGAAIAERLGGILVVAADSLLLFKPSGQDFVCQTLASHLPGLSDTYFPDSPESSVVVSISNGHIVLATQKWIVHLDPATFQVRHYAAIDNHNHRRLESLVIRNDLGLPTVNIASSLVQDRQLQYLFQTLSCLGSVISQSTLESPDFTLIGTPYIRVRPGLFVGASGIVAEVVQTGPAALRVRPLPHLEPDMRYTSSCFGTTLAGVRAGTFVARSENYGTRRFDTDSANYSVYLAEDGRFAVLLYCDGPLSPNVTGVVDLVAARIVGHSRGHVAGLTPYAFSRSGRYFATLVTDCVANHHPDKVPSGTVLLTELPVGD